MASITTAHPLAPSERTRATPKESTTARIPPVAVFTGVSLMNAMATPTIQASITPDVVQSDASADTQIRGASLLLFGRLFALVVNLVAQVLTVRFLSKTDYGALAYALAMAATASHVALLGLGKAVSRFVPIDQERQDYRSMFGTIATALATVSGVGLALVLVTLGLRGVLQGAVIDDPLAVVLLAIVIALAPLQALDHVLQSLLSVFARPRAIFLRRYVLKPLLKLLAIAVVIALHGSVEMLAACYVAAGVLGALLYLVMLWQVLRDERLLPKLDVRSLRFPLRRLFGFSLPLLSSELVLVLKTALAVFLLERMHGAAEVAAFRGVVPLAALSLIVLQSFKFLYVPMASRLLARREPMTIHHLFWRSTVWTTVVSFPIFAVLVFLARPVTVLLLGEDYGDSAVVLAVLTVGGYCNAAMGLNSDTLEVYARIRAITIVAVVTGAVAILLSLLLIPPFGSVGAAVATLGAVVVRNLANHIALAVCTEVRPFDRAYMRVYATIVFASGGLLLVQWMNLGTLPMGVAVIGASFFVVRSNRALLDIVRTFPVLARVSALRPFIGSASHASMEPR